LCPKGIFGLAVEAFESIPQKLTAPALDLRSMAKELGLMQQLQRKL
jgi:hypothetical protein